MSLTTTLYTHLNVLLQLISRCTLNNFKNSLNDSVRRHRWMIDIRASACFGRGTKPTKWRKHFSRH